MDSHLKRKARNSSDDLIGCLLAPYLSEMEIPHDLAITFQYLRNQPNNFLTSMHNLKKTRLENSGAGITDVIQPTPKHLIDEARFTNDKLAVLHYLPRTTVRDARVHQLQVYGKQLKGCYMELVRTPLEMMVALNLILMTDPATI